VVRVAVDVDVAHLANPLLAASRLLASEAGGLVRIDGDEEHFEVTVAVADRTPQVLDQADAWVRWAVHNAGIRGRVRRLDRPAPDSPPDLSMPTVPTATAALDDPVAWSSPPPTP
jgi:hypothetical protein